MKMAVVANQQGEIIGAVALTEEQSGEGPHFVGFVPFPEQQVHEVDAPDEFLQPQSREEFHEVLTRYRLADGGLVRGSTSTA